MSTGRKLQETLSSVCANINLQGPTTLFEWNMNAFDGLDFWDESLVCRPMSALLVDITQCTAKHQMTPRMLLHPAEEAFSYDVLSICWCRQCAEACGHSCGSVKGHDSVTEVKSDLSHLMRTEASDAHRSISRSFGAMCAVMCAAGPTKNLTASQVDALNIGMTITPVNYNAGSTCASAGCAMDPLPKPQV